ncbi:radical SAM protein [bacterium]|nr:radical SAM protein [bacterium]
MLALRLYRQAKKLARLATKTRADTPREVQLEVTNRCNLDCDMCPRLILLKVPEVDMSWETFTQVLDRLDSPESITLTGWGEPLMHPRIFDFVAEIHRRFPSCDVSFTTNAHFFTEAFIEKILAARVSRVNVSLEELPWSDAEATTPPPSDFRTGNPMKGHENYVARDGHPTPRKVVDRLRRFLDRVNAERAAGRDFPEVRMQVVLFPEGTEIMLRLVDFAAEAGFHAVNLVRLDVRGRPDLRRPSWEDERRMIALARERAESLGVPLGSVNDHGALLKLASHSDRFCVRLDNFIYVDVSGNVAPCCLLRGHRVGNLVEQPLREIWHGERMKRFYGPGVHPACVGCDAFLNCYAEPAPLERRALPIASVSHG